MNRDERNFSIWAIGGGKGGTGKSVVSSLLSIWLARIGKKTILLDADLGGANMHTLFGLKLPKVTLHDFVEKRVSTLDEAVIDTGVPNLGLISGATDVLSMANPKYGQKTRMLNAIGKLDAEVVVLDLGAGTHYNTLDFALLSDVSLVVLNPQMTSIENGYGFLKGMLYRQLERHFKDGHVLHEHLAPALSPEPGTRGVHLSECVDRIRAMALPESAELEEVLEQFQPHVVVNKCSSDKDAMASEVVRNVARRYLGITPTALRPIPLDPEVSRSLDTMKPLHTLPRGAIAMAAAYEATLRLLGSQPGVQDETPTRQVGQG